jgi:hypothetical protein
VAVAADGTTFTATIPWREAAVLAAPQSVTGSNTSLFSIAAAVTAAGLLREHPILAFGTDNADPDDPYEREFECLLGWLAARSCSPVVASAWTGASFDALVAALRASGMDKLDPSVQDHLYDAAFRVQSDLAAAFGVTASDVQALLAASALGESWFRSHPMGFVTSSDQYTSLATVDVDRAHYSLSVKGDDRVLPVLDPGARVWLTKGGGRGVDFTFRYYQADATQYTSAADLAAAAGRGNVALSSWQSETRLIPRNSVFERASVFNAAINAVKAAWNWVSSLFGAKNEDPNSIVLPRNHAYVVVGTSPGWGLNVRSGVDADWDRIAGFPGLRGDVIANRIHNFIGLALDVYSATGASFATKISKGVMAKVYEEALTCALGKVTGYFAGDWQTDASVLQNVAVDVFGCVGTAFLKANLSQFVGDNEEFIDAWFDQADALIAQKMLLVGDSLEGMFSSQLTATDGSVDDVAPQELVTILLLVGKAVEMWEKGMAAGAALHRLGDMFFFMTPLEIAVIEIGSPAYASKPPTVYELTVIPGIVLGIAPANGSATSTIELENTGTGNLTITSIQPDTSWITVSPTNIASLAAGDTATVTVTMNAAGLPSGRNTAEVDIAWRPASGGTTSTTTVTADLTVTATTITGTITTLPTGNWRATILHPSLLERRHLLRRHRRRRPHHHQRHLQPRPRHHHPTPRPPRHPSQPPRHHPQPPQCPTAPPSPSSPTTTPTTTKQLDPGETIYEIDDPSQHLRQRRPHPRVRRPPLHHHRHQLNEHRHPRQLERRPPPATGAAPSTAPPTAGTAVEVTHDNRLTNLQLTPGRQGTIGTSGITTFTTPTTPTPRSIFHQP